MAFTNVAGHLGAVAGTGMRPIVWADFVRLNLLPALYIRQLLTRVPIPRANGDTIKISRWATPLRYVNNGVRQNYASVSAGATNAAPAISMTAEPTGPIAQASIQALGQDTISGTIQCFRGARGYTDKVAITSVASFLEGAYNSLVDELAWKIENYSWYALSGAPLTLGAGGAASGSVRSAGVLTGAEIAKIAPYMLAAGAPRWDDDTYVAVGTPLAQYDLMTDTASTGFVSVKRYGDPGSVYRGELGEMYGVRFLLDGAVPKYVGLKGMSANATGSNMLVVAPNWAYSVELQDGGLEVRHNELGSGGTSDPTGDIGTVGVKVYYGVIPCASTDGLYMRVMHGLTLR